MALSMSARTFGAPWSLQKAMQAGERQPLCSMSKEVSNVPMTGCLPRQPTATHSIKHSVSKGTSGGPRVGCHLGQCYDLQGCIRRAFGALLATILCLEALVHDTLRAKCEVRHQTSAGWDSDFLVWRMMRFHTREQASRRSWLVAEHIHVPWSRSSRCRRGGGGGGEM
jgi:hypothetical protein